jgi:hypothetical protein
MCQGSAVYKLSPFLITDSEEQISETVPKLPDSHGHQPCSICSSLDSLLRFPQSISVIGDPNTIAHMELASCELQPPTKQMFQSSENYLVNRPAAASELVAMTLQSYG